MSVKHPTREQIEEAKLEIYSEDVEALRAAAAAVSSSVNKQRNLPSEHPDHVCGVMCDGADGPNSYCARLRQKLFR